MARVREKQPGLVIFDLNSARLNPLAAIKALKADPELQSIRTLGYVSHVDSDTIAAARSAGIDQVTRPLGVHRAPRRAAHERMNHHVTAAASSRSTATAASTGRDEDAGSPGNSSSSSAAPRAASIPAMPRSSAARAAAL